MGTNTYSHFCQAQFQQTFAVAIELRQHYNHYWTNPTPPDPTPPGIAPRCSSRITFATFDSTGELLKLSGNLKHEDDLKFEDNPKYEGNLKYEDDLKRKTT